MIKGLLQLLLFQALGEIISIALLPALPGPVIGMVALLAWLLVRKNVDDDLARVSAALTRHLGLLFVPAAVGIMVFLPELRTHAWAVTSILLASVVCSLAATAGVLKLWSKP